MRDTFKTPSWDNFKKGITAYRETTDLRKLLYKHDIDDKLEKDEVWEFIEDQLDIQSTAFLECIDTKAESAARKAYASQTDNMVENINQYLNYLIQIIEKNTEGDPREKRVDVYSALHLWEDAFSPTRACFNPIILSHLNLWEAKWTEKAIETIRPEILQIGPNITQYHKLKAYSNRNAHEWTLLFEKEKPEYFGANERARAAYAFIRSIYFLSPTFFRKAEMQAEGVAKKTYEFWVSKEPDIALIKVASGPEAQAGLRRIVDEMDRLYKDQEWKR